MIYEYIITRDPGYEWLWSAREANRNPSCVAYGTTPWEALAGCIEWQSWCRRFPIPNEN